MVNLNDKKKIIKFFKNEARGLEKSIFNYYFQNGNEEEVIQELRKYQNPDGGFGHGLESDFRLPLSSPIATSVGVRILSELDGLSEGKKMDKSASIKEMIKLALGYFEDSYNEQRKGWFALIREVNNYPHTPWWHYDEESNMTVIDKNWGNPSAEIIAYLYKYREHVRNLDIDYLVTFALEYIMGKENFDSENELFCYIKLYEVLPEDFRKRLEPEITRGVSQVVEYDNEKWTEYVPLPLDFVPGPESCNFGVDEEKIKENLDYYQDIIGQDKVIIPSWGDSFYQGGLQPAYNEWKGVLTLKVLKTLDNYKMLKY